MLMCAKWNVTPRGDGEFHMLGGSLAERRVNSRRQMRERPHENAQGNNHSICFSFVPTRERRAEEERWL